MVFIYILKLKYNKFYIGKTDNPEFRLKNHFNKEGSLWTKKYDPIKLYQLIPDCDDFDEDKWTLKYMEKYGIDNVRGGSFCSIQLSKENKIIINKMLKSTTNKCYKCGSEDHFANKCTSVNEKYKCSFCDKSFTSKKGALYHEKKYCMYKTDTYEETDSVEDSDFKQEFINKCLKFDKYKKNTLEIEQILFILKDCLDEFDDWKLTHIRGMCQTINKSDKCKYIPYKNGYINYNDFIDGLLYIINNKTQYCDLCGQEGHNDDNCHVYNKKSHYPKKNRIKKCFRCGRTGHFSNKCYAKTDTKGNYLI